MIDLHTHTYESDGTCAPVELVRHAADAGLEAIAITDHDTFSGYDEARREASGPDIELVCGIEVSTKWEARTVHLLGYFMNGGPRQAFRDWIVEMQESRRDRNRRLIARLRSLGVDITLEEVEALGLNMTGRPHFARLMVKKGIVSDYRQAFDEYLDESAKGYVDRREPQLAEAVAHVRQGGGVASLAHPVRFSRDPARLEALIGGLRDAGLNAIEAFHSDHSAGDVALFLDLAKRFDLKLTGGSDFHGDNKPEARLGAVSVPRSVLESLRTA